jgi:hypothetical protein
MNHERLRWIAAVAVVVTVIVVATLSVRHYVGSGAGGNDPGQAAIDAKASTPGVVAQIASPSRANAVATAQQAAAANGDAEACGRALQALLTTRAEQLSSGEDARDRLAAVILKQDDDFPRYRRAFDRELELAVAQHPDDTLLQWLRATHCLESERCDEAAILEPLRRLDPGNSLPYLLALDAAVKRADSVRAEVLLAEAARQTRLDVYWGRLSKRIVEVVGPAGDAPACGRAVAGPNPLNLDFPRTLQANVEAFAGGVGAAQMIPLGVLKLCPVSRRIPETRLPACRALFAQMATNDTLLLHSIGAQGLWKNASTPAELAHWSEEVRNVEWMKREGYPLLRAGQQPLLWEQGEVPVLIALLEGQGRWPAPPGWQPPAVVP